MSDIILLYNLGTLETRKGAFYFTSIAVLVLELFKFLILNFMTALNALAGNMKYFN